MLPFRNAAEKRKKNQLKVKFRSTFTTVSTSTTTSTRTTTSTSTTAMMTTTVTTAAMSTTSMTTTALTTTTLIATTYDGNFNAENGVNHLLDNGENSNDYAFTTMTTSTMTTATMTTTHLRRRRRLCQPLSWNPVSHKM